MVRYDTYSDTGITIRYVSRYIYYPLIYEMQNCVIEVPIRIYYNIWGNTYQDTIFSLTIRIVGAVYQYIVIHWWIMTSLPNDLEDIGQGQGSSNATPSHAIDHLYQIWKESILNCRCHRADTGCRTDRRTDGRTEWNQYNFVVCGV